VTRSALAAVHSFIDAVESRNLDAVDACFTADATYANVPHPPAVGRGAIRRMFEVIVRRSDRIEWEVLAEASAGDTAFAERVDRFWIGGRLYDVECSGVYRVDPDTGLIKQVRDYVDLGVWRARLGDVLETWSAS